MPVLAEEILVLGKHPGTNPGTSTKFLRMRTTREVVKARRSRPSQPELRSPTQKVNKPRNSSNGRHRIEGVLETFSLRGYHCTRLTESEIADVKKNGVVPLSPEFLARRIRRSGLREDVTELLLKENRVDEKFRQNMIWFCLFPPEWESHGVQRFFRSWGRESLYADHERHPSTGPILRQTGIPCVIELLIPIRLMHHQFFGMTMP